MVVRIRLQRHGCVHRPFYRIAVAHSKRHVSKKVIDYVGTYDPLVDAQGNKQIRLNIPRVKYWLAVGAQPSDRMKKLLAQFSLLPLPPLRTDEPASAALARGLTGQGGKDEQKGEDEGKEARQPRIEWALTGDSAPAASSSSSSPPPPRYKYRHTPDPHARAFPFSIAPTELTLAAWEQARKLYALGRPKPKTTQGQGTQTGNAHTDQQHNAQPSAAPL